MKKFIVKEWAELISDPVTMSERDQRAFGHDDLPLVKDEVSVTLRIKIESHGKWCFIFIKGSEPDRQRTPSLSLSNRGELYPRYSTNNNWDVGTQTFSDALRLNKWYHLAVTVSDLEKRIDLYVDGQWLESGCIAQVTKEYVMFNTKPFHIGHTAPAPGFNGQISNVRYFNWRLSAEEVKKDSLVANF